MDILECQRRDLEESFSFLNSTVKIFSSDDDEDDNESCFEIALEPTKDADEFEIRISFSTVPVLDIPSPNKLFFDKARPFPLQIIKNSQTDGCSSSEYSTEISSGDESATAPATPSTELSTPPKTKESKLPFPAVSRNVNIFLRGTRRSSPIGGKEHGCPDKTPQSMVNNENRELVQSQKTSKIITIINGRIMKFFIKCRSVNVRSSIVSFINSCQLVPQQSNSTKDDKRRGTMQTLSHQYWRLTKPFERWFVQRGACGKNNKSTAEKSEKSGVMEVNVDAIRGALEAVGLSLGRKVKEAKNTPSSMTSSPIHRGGAVSQNFKHNNARENLVQGAIAHCKGSSI